MVNDFFQCKYAISKKGLQSPNLLAILPESGEKRRLSKMLLNGATPDHLSANSLRPCFVA